MKSTSRNHGAPFKAPAAMKGDKTLAEWAGPCHVPPPRSPNGSRNDGCEPRTSWAGRTRRRTRQPARPFRPRSAN